MPIVSQNSIFVATAVWKLNNGRAVFAVLEKNPNNNQYLIHFDSNSQNDDSNLSNQQFPNFQSEVYPLNNDQNANCFGLQMLDFQNAIVECIQKNGATVSTIFYIANRSQGQVSSLIKGSSLVSSTQIRKTIYYSNSSYNFIISFYSNDPQTQNKPAKTENLINIYQYSVPKTQSFGSITSLGAIAQSQFLKSGQTSVNLQIIDIEVLGDRIFLLDATLGLFSFQLNQLGKLVNLISFSSFPFPKAYGLATRNVGGNNIIVVASQNILWEFTWNNYQQQPFLQNQYEIDQASQFISGGANTVQIDLNYDFMVVQNGALLSIYQRGKSQSEFIIASFKDATAFVLLSINNLLLLRASQSYGSAIEYYQIQAAPILMVNPQDADQQTYENIILTSQSKSGDNIAYCSQILNMYILQDENSKDIFQTGISIINQSDVLSNQQFTKILIGQDLFGPNIQLGQASIQLSQVVQPMNNLQQQNQLPYIYVDDPGTVTLSKNSIIKQTTAIFQRIFAVSDTQHYILNQLDDGSNTAYIFNCQANGTYPFSVDCGNAPVKQIQLGGKIKAYTQTNYNGNLVWICTTSNNPSQIQAFNFQDGSAVTDLQLNLNNINIVDIENSENLLFILGEDSNKNRQIYIYKLQQGLPISSITPITSDIVANFPTVNQPFFPINLILNSNLPATLFVQSNNNQIIVFSLLDNSLTFLSAVNIAVNQQQPWQFAIGKTTMAVVAFADQNNNQGFIQEYSLLDLTNIYPLRTLPLYGMTLNQINTMQFSENSEILYVLIQNTNTLNTFLAAYRLNVFKAQALYQIFPVSTTTVKQLPALQNILLSVDGLQGQADYVYLRFAIQNINLKTKPTTYFQVFRFASQPTLIIDPIPQQLSQTFVDQMIIQFSASSWDKKSFQQNYAINANIIYNNFALQSNDDQINQIQQASSLWNVTASQPFPQYFIIPDYPVPPFSLGNVPSYQLQCTYGCNQTVQFHNHLEPSNWIQSPIGGISNPIDIVDDIYSNKFYVLTSANIIYQLNGNLGLQTQYNLSQACDRIYPFYQNKQLTYILAFCFDQNKGYYMVQPITIVKPKTKQQPIIKQFFMPNVFDLGDVTITEDDGILLILNLGVNNQQNQFYKTTQGSLYVYALWQSNQNQVPLVQSFDEGSLNYKDLNITSFSFMQTDTPTVNKIILSNNNQYLFSIDVSTTDYKSFAYQFIDLQSFIQSQGYFLPDSEKIVKLAQIQSQNQDSLNEKLLVFTENIGILEIDFSYQSQTDVNPILKPVSLDQLVNVYSNYGKNSIINTKLQIYYPNSIDQINWLLIVPYYNQITQNVILTVYSNSNQGKQSSYNTQDGQATYQFIPMIGGYSMGVNDINKLAFSFYLSSPNDSSTLKIMYTDQYGQGLNLLDFNQNIYIEVDNSKFNSQSLLINAQGDQSQGESISVYIALVGGNNQNNNEQSSGRRSGWFWVFVLLLSGIGGFYCYKNMQRNQENSRLNQENNFTELRNLSKLKNQGQQQLLLKGQYVQDTDAEILSPEVGADMKAKRKAYKKRDANESRQAHIKSALHKDNNNNKDNASDSSSHSEGHGEGDQIKSAVFGGLDGMIVGYSVVVGATAARLEPQIIMIMGVSNGIADGVAMALGDFISSKSESDFVKLERQREEWEVNNLQQCEEEEMRQIYIEKGMTKQDADEVVEILTRNKEVWINIMLVEELGLVNEESNSVLNAIVTFISFCSFGSVSLIPYIIGDIANLSVDYEMTLFAVSTTAYIIFLFILGVLRSQFTSAVWYISGCETLAIGIITASSAYFVGKLFRGLVNEN